jgi:hypothetical protein
LSIKEDEYSPEVKKHERNGGTRTMSESSKSSTVSEDSLYVILNRLHVAYLAKEVVHVWGEFWVSGEPVSLIPDCLIIDKRYFPGVIEVQGSVHKTKGSIRKDARKEKYYGKMHLWVEFVENRDVKQANIEAILAQHRRQELKKGEFP